MVSGIETELFLPPPRAVREREPRRKPRLLLRLFPIPHSLVGAASLLYAVFHLLMLLAGETAEGVVTARTSTAGGDDGPSWQVAFRYAALGEVYEGSCSVDKETFDASPRGSPVPVRFLGVLPGQGARIPGAGDLWKFGVLPWFFTLFWNLILSVFVWQVWIRPLRMRRLVVRGQAVPGRVIERERGSGTEARTYTLGYTFTPLETPSLLRRASMRVGKDQWDRIPGGAELTVLYEPGRPGRSILYACGPYEAVSRHPLQPDA
ncbi:MAG: DUF3592 domain-containing protein [Bacteroidota bacterium]